MRMFQYDDIGLVLLVIINSYLYWNLRALEYHYGSYAEGIAYWEYYGHTSEEAVREWR